MRIPREADGAAAVAGIEREAQARVGNLLREAWVLDRWDVCPKGVRGPAWRIRGGKKRGRKNSSLHTTYMTLV